MSLSPEQFVHEFASPLCSVRQQFVYVLSVSDRYRARMAHQEVPVDSRFTQDPSFDGNGEFSVFPAQPLGQFQPWHRHLRRLIPNQ